MGSKYGWADTQRHADELLAEGLWNLRQHPATPFTQSISECAGNYLISLDSTPQYIGEAADLRARLSQQFRPRTSTFHKTYCKKHGEWSIDRFAVQTMETSLGRKEIEESGIVNLRCGLNKFQLGKRRTHTAATSALHWMDVQTRSDELLKEGEQQILNASLGRWTDAAPEQVPGLYLVRRRSDSELLYIGESSDLAERCYTHSYRTRMSALRRHIATELLSLTLKKALTGSDQKAHHLSQDEDRLVNEFLCGCNCAFIPVGFGRFELEEYLIHHHAPTLNRKGNHNTQ